MRTSIDLLRDHFKTWPALATAAGLKHYQTAQQWDKNCIPAQYVLPLCEASGWEITPHMLRPDLYPNADDALPMSMRVAA
jgi:hypothetical protein